MKIKINFDKNSVKTTNITDAVLKTGIRANIEGAQIDGYGGWTILDIQNDNANKFIDALKKPGVTIQIIQDSVIHNQNECIDCGICIGVCLKKVFEFDDNWKIRINSTRCVLCGSCVTYCPQRALTLHND
ncbi:MAG TPA: 4Fe-4S binding protein [Methanocorpusculum sp.]|nr:4Fe-4S binding protein [Methanocorpusculum sp.]